MIPAALLAMLAALGVDGTGTPENPETPLEILLGEWERFFSQLSSETRMKFVDGLIPWVQEAPDLDDLEERLKLAQKICVAGRVMFTWKFLSRGSFVAAELRFLKRERNRQARLKSGSPVNHVPDRHLLAAGKKLKDFRDRIEKSAPKVYGGRGIFIEESMDGVMTFDLIDDDHVSYGFPRHKRVRAYSWDETRWLAFDLYGDISIRPRLELQ